MTKRGLRNNNPGNLDFSPANKWQGQVGIETDVPPGVKPRFAKFRDMVYGIRAMAVLLIAYYEKYDCDTILKVMNRWAPPAENNTKTYAQQVAADISDSCDHTVGVNDMVSLHEYPVLRALVCAIIEYENGLRSYREAITDAQIDKALLMAGVEPPKAPIMKTKTIAGASVATVGITATTGIQIINEVKDQVEPLIPYADTMKLIFLVVALLGIALTVYAKFDNRRKGLR